MKNLIFILLSLFSISAITGCRVQPEPINYGSDECSYCRMLITDRKYGSELISSKGKIFKFDSIECLAAYYIKLEDDKEVSLLVTNFDKPSNFLSVNDAVFVQSARLRSPMGLYLSSHSDEKVTENLIEMYGGKILDWEAVQNLVKEKWLEKGGREMMHNH